jgi:hypothetical protein
MRAGPCRRAVVEKEVAMEHRLHLLESFTATGSDGEHYKVCGYERMVPEAPFTHTAQAWEPSGISEYLLADGRAVDIARDGTMRIVGSGVVLRREVQPAETLQR